MWQASLVLMWEPIRDARFFLEMKPGNGFSFTSYKPFEIGETEKLINEKFKKEKKDLFIKITKNALDKNKFDAECFKLT